MSAVNGVLDDVHVYGSHPRLSSDLSETALIRSRSQYLATVKPVLIFDSNALHGAKPFARTAIATLLELSRLGRVRVVVPEVVLHEISRQSMEALEEHSANIRVAIKKLNDLLVDTGSTPVSVALPPRNREDFYNFATELLSSKGVETPAAPDVPVNELLHRDLDARKPFSRDGRGFRDALIWETIRAVCDSLDDPSTPVLLVTSNRSDFYVTQGGELHADLRTDLSPHQSFYVVGSPHHAQRHDSIAPLVESMRALTTTLTGERIQELVDEAIANLDRPLQDFAEYIGEGMHESPISTVLEEADFDEIMPIWDSMTHVIYHVGADGYSIQVAVDAEVSLTGFLDKSDYYTSEYSEVTIIEDWNRHLFRVSERRRQLSFILSATFPEADLDGFSLNVDEIKEPS